VTTAQPTEKQHSQEKRKEPVTTEKQHSQEKRKEPVTTEKQYSIPVMCNGQKMFYHSDKNTKRKTKITVTGDSDVRGLGPLIQDKMVDGTAIVRAGFKIQDLHKHIHKDIDNESDIIFINCGSNNVGRENHADSTSGFDSLMDDLANNQKDKHFVMIGVPPTRNGKLQERVKDLNSHLKSKCRNYSNIDFLTSSLSLSDIDPRGFHLNQIGKKKLASKIIEYTKMWV
jgi:hypothetical protein